MQDAAPSDARGAPARERKAMPVIFAHGALGAFDEVIFMSIAVVFLAMMGLSWARSQELPDEEAEAAEESRESETDRFELE